MNLGNRRLMPTGDPSKRNKMDLLNYLRFHLHLRMKVSYIIRSSKLNLLIIKVNWNKWVVSLLHKPSLVGTTQVLVMRDPVVVSTVIKMGISYERVQ